MAKLFPQSKIESCHDCPYLIHEDYQMYACYKGQFEIKNACDCYVFDEIDSRCPLEDYDEV